MRSSWVMTGSLPEPARGPGRCGRGDRFEGGELLRDDEGAWFGSITPPEPTRMRDVRAAAAAISTGGVVDATAGMLWCSANQ
jgi:hypothetical protein